MTVGLTVKLLAGTMAALALLPLPVRALARPADGAVSIAREAAPGAQPPRTTSQMPRRAQPPRDPRTGAEQPPPVGTAVIRGRVIDGLTSQPVRRASVTIPGREVKPVKTDETGSFIFTALPAGNYQVSAQKSGYLAGQYPDVSKGTVRTRRNFTLANGEVATVTVPLYRGGVITGRVLDEFGDPVDRATIRVISADTRRSSAAGGRGMIGFESTNEVGEFRIGRLREGRYILSARNEMDGAMSRFTAGVDADGPQDSYATTYYPDAASLDQAGILTVERGQTLSGIDVTLSPVSKQLLIGTVTNAKGMPTESFHARIVPIQSNGEKNMFDEARAMGQRNGEFKAWVQPGEYEISVTSFSNQGGNGGERMQGEYAKVRVTVNNEPAHTAIVTSPGAIVTGRVIFSGTSQPPGLESARVLTFVPVRGREEDCRLGEPADVRPDGTFTMTGVWGICRVATEARLGKWRVKSVRHAGTDFTDRPVDLTRVAELRDVEVTLTDQPSSLTLDVTGPAGATTEYVALVFSTDKSRWTDYTAVQVWAPPPPISPVDPTQPGAGSSGGAGVGSGIAPGIEQGPGAGGQGGAGASSVAIATMSGRAANRNMLGWASGFGAGGMMGGSIGGMFQIDGLSNLRAGEYYVVALDDVEIERTRDPAFLEAIAGMATRVTLAEGERRTVSLRRQTAPDEER